MKYFLLIETATEACSAAVADENGILASRSALKPKAQASLLAPMVDEVLKVSEITPGQLSAVGVSMGPGSYTGLRVGVSTAKGICFGCSIPIIGIGTLDILADMGRKECEKGGLIVPMIDARRMEVYTARFDACGKRLSETEAKVLDPTSFEEEFRQYGQLLFIGDGAAKFREILDEDKLAKSRFIETHPDVSGMLRILKEKWDAGNFEDTAYFEPFYLKEFVAGISRKTEKALHF